MNSFGISGAYPVFSCGVLLSLSVGILWASEHEPFIWRCIDFIVTRFLGPLAAPCPEEEANYERY